LLKLGKFQYKIPVFKTSTNGSSPPHSNPNPKNSSFHLPNWSPASSYPVEYARLGTKIEDSTSIFQLENELMQQRADFWRELQPHLPATHAHNEL